MTYGLDVVLTRGSNTYGPFQHPEKLIPLFITNALDEQPLPMYGDGMQQRDWLYVADHAGAIEFVLRHGESGETYNIAGRGRAGQPGGHRGSCSRPLGKPLVAGPDRARIARATTGATPWTARRLASLGWRQQVAFEQGLPETVAWYRDQRGWWRAVKAGDWDAYYERQYGDRLAAGHRRSEPRPARPMRVAVTGRRRAAWVGR